MGALERDGSGTFKFEHAITFFAERRTGTTLRAPLWTRPGWGAGGARLRYVLGQLCLPCWRVQASLPYTLNPKPNPAALVLP